MTDNVENLGGLLRRYCQPDIDPLSIPRVNLAEALASGKDPLDVLAYLGRLGFIVRALDDLLEFIADRDEDEVHCFRVEEGIAVTISGPGGWVVFTSWPDC